ncbi:MAG: imelysin family protein [Labilithrix sp.]|nr:imelysin family protein [Labilithrix sp.]
MKRYIGSFLAVAVLCGTSCRSRSGDSGGPSASSGGVDAGSFDKPALLRAIGDCVVADYREFATSTVALDAATATAAADKSEASIEAARAVWKTAMDTWERAELYQFGPAAISTAPGGRDMRDPIYAWPLVGRCALEQTIVSKAYEAPGWATTALVSTRSLAAAEYLLFYTGADNACPPENEINTSGGWAALGAEELAARRLAYARVVTADVVQRAQALVDAWDPAKGNFLEELATAGRSKSFASEQMAFNAITDAMFYLDLQLKNTKVGVPAGFLPECAAAPCLSSVESPWAKRSKEHIRQNVAGYEKIFRGCGPNGSGLGFDDLLGAVGAESVTAKVEASLAEIHAALDALVEPTFEEDLQKNLAGVQRLFDALRANASVMKAELVTVLDLELPRRAESDND